MPAPDKNTSSSLLQIEAEAWQLLENGSSNPKDGFYTGTLGTQTTTGVSLRTVVLRKTNSAEKKAICYSDVRADKVQQIRQRPGVSFLFWDSEKKIQLRLTGKATVHFNDPLALQYWEHTSLSNRRSYLTITSPGTSQPRPASGLPDELDKREPSQEESERGRENFAIIGIQVEHLDWLFLNSNGHRRAQFVYKAGHLINKEWSTP